LGKELAESFKEDAKNDKKRYACLLIARKIFNGENAKRALKWADFETKKKIFGAAWKILYASLTKHKEFG